MKEKMSGRIYYLDVIRATAIIIIIVYHFNCAIIDKNITAFHSIFYENANISWGVVGVKLFLMVSGAVLMYQYQKHLELKTFYWKRIKSIFPLFYIAYIIAFISRYFLLHTEIPTIPLYRFGFTIAGLDGYLSQFLPMFNLVGDWFIGVILIFYVLFPLFKKAVEKKRTMLLGFTVLALLISVCLKPFNVSAATGILGNLFPFVFGMCFAYREAEMLRLVKNKGSILLGIAVLITGNSIFTSILVSILLWVGFYYLPDHLKKYSAVYIISTESYAMFLMHHFILTFILSLFANQTLTLIQVFGVLLFCFIVIFISAQVIKWIQRVVTKVCIKR